MVGARFGFGSRQEGQEHVHCREGAPTVLLVAEEGAVK